MTPGQALDVRDAVGRVDDVADLGRCAWPGSYAATKSFSASRMTSGLIVSSAIVFPFSVPVVQLLAVSRRRTPVVSSGVSRPAAGAGRLSRDATLASMTSSAICTRRPPTTEGSTTALTRTSRRSASRAALERSSCAVAERRGGHDRRDLDPALVGDEVDRVAEQLADAALTRLLHEWPTITTVCGEALPARRRSTSAPLAAVGPSRLPSASSSSGLAATARAMANSSPSIATSGAESAAAREGPAPRCRRQVGRVGPALRRRAPSAARRRRRRAAPNTATTSGRASRGSQRVGQRDRSCGEPPTTRAAAKSSRAMSRSTGRAASVPPSSPPGPEWLRCPC